MVHAAVGRVFLPLLAFVFLATPASAVEEIPWEWPGIEKTVVVGDLHGDLESFVKILKGTGVVDEELRWAAGKAHLVQMGDILDRGSDARKILDLLIRLEEEAAAAGGMVHVLSGNHEELNLTGIVFSSSMDHVTLDQFISFLPEGYRKKQEESLTKKLVKLRAKDPNRNLEEAINEFWKSQRADPGVQKLYVLNLNEEYGPWLRRRNVAIKISDVGYVHGGISEKYSKWGSRRSTTATEWNWRTSASPASSSLPDRHAGRLSGDSPLVQRTGHLPEADMKEEVDAILENLGARAMVIAHTPMIPRTPRDMQRFGGRVWIVDTGISRAYGGPASALIIQNGDFHVWGVVDENENSNSERHGLLPHLPRAGHLDPVPAAR
jgi:hypothetical protein